LWIEVRNNKREWPGHVRMCQDVSGCVRMCQGHSRRVQEHLETSNMSPYILK